MHRDDIFDAILTGNAKQCIPGIESLSLEPNILFSNHRTTL